MDIQCLADQLSDEEVFIGKLTLKEVKKRLKATPVPSSHHRRTIGNGHADCKDASNSSIKIIEIHSAPDVSSNGDIHATAISKSESTPSLSPKIETFCDWDIKPDDSFLKMEQMLSNMMTPKKHMDSEEGGEANPFISPKGQIHGPVEKTKYNEMNPQTDNKVLILPKENDIINQIATVEDETKNLVLKTPLKNNYMKLKLPGTVTSHEEVFKTPSSEFKLKTPLFKTPGNPSSQKKLGTPSRLYQNVVSPVATYIRNCPQVPLIKDIYPKKPLPGASSIPKLKHVSQHSGNKENFKQKNVKPVKQENVKLPMLAYRNAKETKMIDVPDIGKMPKSQWARQLASSIPRATVVKHNHRETGSTKKPFQNTQENSFADLSLHQADLSVCTQTSTFNNPKKKVN